MLIVYITFFWNPTLVFDSSDPLGSSQLPKSLIFVLDEEENIHEFEQILSEPETLQWDVLPQENQASSTETDSNPQMSSQLPSPSHSHSLTNQILSKVVTKMASITVQTASVDSVPAQFSVG